MKTGCRPNPIGTSFPTHRKVVAKVIYVLLEAWDMFWPLSCAPSHLLPSFGCSSPAFCLKYTYPFFTSVVISIVSPGYSFSSFYNYLCLLCGYAGFYMSLSKPWNATLLNLGYIPKNKQHLIHFCIFVT